MGLRWPRRTRRTMSIRTAAAASTTWSGRCLRLAVVPALFLLLPSSCTAAGRLFHGPSPGGRRKVVATCCDDADGFSSSPRTRVRSIMGDERWRRQRGGGGWEEVGPRCRDGRLWQERSRSCSASSIFGVGPSMEGANAAAMDDEEGEGSGGTMTHHGPNGAAIAANGGTWRRRQWLRAVFSAALRVLSRGRGVRRLTVVPPPPETPLLGGVSRGGGDADAARNDGDEGVVVDEDEAGLDAERWRRQRPPPPPPKYAGEHHGPMMRDDDGGDYGGHRGYGDGGPPPPPDYYDEPHQQPPPHPGWEDHYDDVGRERGQYHPQQVSWEQERQQRQTHGQRPPHGYGYGHVEGGDDGLRRGQQRQEHYGDYHLQPPPRERPLPPPQLPGGEEDGGRMLPPPDLPAGPDGLSSSPQLLQPPQPDLLLPPPDGVDDELARLRGVRPEKEGGKNAIDLAQFDKDLIFDGLKRLYRKKILPLELASKYGHFHSPPLSPSDFDARPMVLLVGQYSVGKTSFIKHLLGRDFPGIRIGPEPTTDRFTAIMAGDNDKIIPGAALCAQADRPFRGLSPFGNNFLSRFEGATMTDSPVLLNVTLVDTPGILSGKKQSIGRNYDYEQVMKWFAERADLIIIMFDAHKLDISDELKRVIELMVPHQDKIRVLLNKADSISTQQLMRVYGALMWSLGKVMMTPEVCRVYIGSFWGAPLKHTEQAELFRQEQNDLLNDIAQLPVNAVMRRINELVKRARGVKVHAYIIHYLRKQLPYTWGKREKQRRLIDRLDREFLMCARRYELPKGDFPPLEPFRQALLEIKDLSEFPKLDKKMVKEMDKVFSVDIPELLEHARDH